MATVLRFLSLLFCALSLAPALAHLFEMQNKMMLSRAEYLVVQKIYAGWWMLGVAVFGALLFTLALAMAVRKRVVEFVPTLIAIVCLAGAQAVFWIYTFPTNQQTADWTVLPDNWEALRMQWEYSHATGAILHLVALVAIIIAVLARKA